MVVSKATRWRATEWQHQMRPWCKQVKQRRHPVTTSMHSTHLFALCPERAPGERDVKLPASVRMKLLMGVG